MREIESEGREKMVQEDERKGRKRDNKGDVAPSPAICPRKRWNSCGRRRQSVEIAEKEKEEREEQEREMDSWIEEKGREEMPLATMGSESEGDKERNGQPPAGKKTDRAGARERGGGLHGKGR